MCSSGITLFPHSNNLVCSIDAKNRHDSKEVPQGNIVSTDSGRQLGRGLVCVVHFRILYFSECRTGSVLENAFCLSQILDENDEARLETRQMVEGGG